MCLYTLFISIIVCGLPEYVLEEYNTGVKLRIQIIVFKQRIAMGSQGKKMTAL